MNAAPAPRTDAAPSMRIDARTATWIAAALALLAFVPAVHGGFVYDDHRFLEGNQHLTSPSILWRAFTDPAAQTADSTYAGLWRPLRTLSFALDRAMFGTAAWAPHAVNVVLHAVGAACVTALLARWRLPAVAALLGGALYAVHPVQVESVAWVSSRGDLLAAAGVWGALLAGLQGRPRLAATLGVAALLSKEQAIVWPLLAALSHRLAGRAWSDSLRAARAPAALAVAFLAVRHFAVAEPFQEGGLGSPSLPTFAAMAVHQLWTLVVPGAARFDWQMPELARPALVALLVLLAAAVVFVRVRTGRAALLWAGAALLPTLFLQAVVPLNIRVADRFLLFAVPALSYAVARGLAVTPSAWPAAVLAAAAFTVQTETRIPIWRSDAVLWRHVAAEEPAHWRANGWLGLEALRENRVEDAERHLLTAADVAPLDAKTRCQLAAAQELIGLRDRDVERVKAALLNYSAAIDLFGRTRQEGADELVPAARWAQAELLLVLGDREPAAEAIEALLAERPEDYAPRAALLVRGRAGRLADAVETHVEPALAQRIREWVARLPQSGGRP